MVLHQNKWDKKAKKAHVRKLKSKGKEDDTQKGNPRQPRGSVHNPPSSDCDSGESETEDEAEKEKPEEEGTRQKTLGENTTADPTSLAESGDGGDSHAGSGDGFSKRKVHSNAWRYEEEESEFPLTRDADAEDSEPEPDYVQLTRDRKEQMVDAHEAKVHAGLVDEDFLRESSFSSRPLAPVKGRVIKVDRKEFQDVTEKISKQSNVNAFKARFAQRKQKTRTPAVSDAWEKDSAGDSGNIDDVDAFLGELQLEGRTSSTIKSSVSTVPQTKPTAKSTGKKAEFDDEWLDGMLS